jgi:hypothetical protein
LLVLPFPLVAHLEVARGPEDPAAAAALTERLRVTVESLA